MPPTSRGSGMKGIPSISRYRHANHRPLLQSFGRHRTASTTSTRSRFARVNLRLPKFLQRYTTPLLTAPLTHISAFLILHELTAVLPLLSLAGLFHYTHWLPPFISDSKWIAEGVERFGNYFRRKGWISSEAKNEIERVEEGGEWTERKDRVWGWTEGGTRVVVEFATAYAITKALLPLRLMLSVWATPWFAARALTPLTNLFSRMRPGGKVRAPSQLSPAGGTNAVGGGVTAAPPQ